MLTLPSYRRNGRPNQGFKEKAVYQLSKKPMTGRELSALFHMSLGDFNALMRGCLRGETAVITASDPVPVDGCTDFTYTLVSTRRTTHKNPKAIVVSWRAFGMVTNDSQRINTEAAQRRARLIKAGHWPVANKGEGMSEIKRLAEQAKKYGSLSVTLPTDDVLSMLQKLDAVVAENVALKLAFNPEQIPEEAVEAFTETAIMDHDWNDTGEWSWVENDTDVIRAILEAIKPETPATDAILNAVRAEGAVIASQSISKAVSCFQGVHAGAVMECADIAREVGIGISAGVVKGGSDE